MTEPPIITEEMEPEQHPTRPRRSRPLLLAVGALLLALAGGAAALGIGAAAGWIGGDETVILSSAPSPAADGAATRASVPADRSVFGDFDPAAIYRERAPGVVTIYSAFADHAGTDITGAGQGSGFVVSEDGYVLTNSHVITTAGVTEEPDPESVEPATEVYVEFADGDRAQAEIVGWDLFYDIGVIKVDPDDHELQPVPLGDSRNVVVGEPVAAIGSPFGQAGSLAIGVVSAIERSVDSLTSAYSVADAIQTDAPINRGNSGGPLFNQRGEVIGINAQIRSESGNAEGVGFAIPINIARRSMEQLIQTGRVRYAWIGISTRTVTPSIAAEADLPVDSGAAVQCIVPGSPAAKAGLEAGAEELTVEGIGFTAGGDVVVAINDETVATTEDLGRIVASSLFPGETASFTIVRDGKRIAVPVVLGDRPNEASASC
jgi:S1-C subfamily serine protease